MGTAGTAQPGRDEAGDPERGRKARADVALPGRERHGLGTCTVERGTMQVAEIGTLRAVVGAMPADEGAAFLFCHRLAPVQYVCRTAVMYGRTGRELVFADAMRRVRDGLEAGEGR